MKDIIKEFRNMDKSEWVDFILRGLLMIAWFVVSMFLIAIAAIIEG